MNTTPLTEGQRLRTVADFCLSLHSSMVWSYEIVKAQRLIAWLEAANRQHAPPSLIASNAPIAAELRADCGGLPSILFRLFGMVFFASQSPSKVGNASNRSRSSGRIHLSSQNDDRQRTNQRLRISSNIWPSPSFARCPGP